MIRALASICIIATALLSSLPAAAADLQPGAPSAIVVQAAAPAERTITLTTSSHVDYAPDLALLSLGARANGPTAAAAATRTNAIGDRILAALEALGIAKKDLQTTQYEVTFVEATDPVYSPALSGRARIITQPGHAAYYTVSTTFAVKAPIARAGAAIDAAVGAGANSSYDLSFASSHIDDFYAQALSNAMQSAHARASALAAAAGVTLADLQSISTSGGPSADAPAPEGEAMMATRAKSAAPIVAGTQSVDASVDVIYTIK